MRHSRKKINIIRSNKAAVVKGRPGKAQGRKRQKVVLALVGIDPKGSVRPCFSPNSLSVVGSVDRDSIALFPLLEGPSASVSLRFKELGA